MVDGSTALYGIWINRLQRFSSRIGLFSSVAEATAVLVKFGYTNSTDAVKPWTAHVAFAGFQKAAR